MDSDSRAVGNEKEDSLLWKQTLHFDRACRLWRGYRFSSPPRAGGGWWKQQPYQCVSAL